MKDNVGPRPSYDYTHYLQLNQHYERLRLKVLEDMVLFSASHSQGKQQQGSTELREPTRRQEEQQLVVTGPSILEEEESVKKAEELRQAYFKLFVASGEKSGGGKVPQSQQEEQKWHKTWEQQVVVGPSGQPAEVRENKQPKKRSKSKKRSKNAKKHKQTQEQPTIRSTATIRAELTTRMMAIQGRLTQIENQAHEELMHAEDNYGVQNMELLEKIFPTFMELLAVRWEETTDALIDDLLYEVVRELNIIDAVLRPYSPPPKPLKENLQPKREADVDIDLLEVLGDYLHCEQDLNAKYAALSD